MFIKDPLKLRTDSGIICGVKGKQMQNLSKTVCEKFRTARRDHGLTQTALAAEIGCHQAALSMFEKGNVTKLSTEYVEKIATRLGIDLEAIKEQAVLEEGDAEKKPTAMIGFCPENECPSNVSYAVAGRTFYKVTLQKGRYCAFCGEVLETKCPACGAPLNEGACCSACGKPYVK